MARFSSWLIIGVASAFLVVATLSFSVSTAVWLAFGVGIGTMVVAAGISYGDRRHVYSLIAGLSTMIVSVWTIVASLVFAQSTAQVLAFASALALCGLAAAGITVHELMTERALSYSLAHGGQPKRGLTAA